MKAAVIISGGMDSTVLLHHVAHEYGAAEVVAIAFDYGQRHRRELECAQWQAQAIGCEFLCISITDYGRALHGNSQTDLTQPVPEGHYSADTMKQTVVPNRNMVMLSIAAGIAMSRGAGALYYGAHAGDHAVYPDCRPEFVDALKAALMLADWSPLRLVGPFIKMTKADIVSLGAALGVDFGHTHTCYAGTAIACGKCGTCVERREAFDLAKALDPVEYADRHWWRTAQKPPQ
jgi:7-cyano-7-deazaguanine synthase